jgi:predicted dehydrogenase
MAVIGTGFQGQGHLAALKNIEGADVVGICDKNEETLRKAEKKSEAPAFKDAAEMLDKVNPEGVVICTPPEARVGPVTEAVDRGIHCFIEKPPAKEMEKAEEINRILKRGKVIHSVGFMMRYSKAVIKCRDWISGRKISLVRSAMLDGLALRENWPRWFFDKKISGGPLFDQAIHIFDLSRFILQDEVAEIGGFQDNLVVSKSDDFTVEDSFSLAMRYRGGSLQNHSHSWVYPGYMTQIELISDELHLTVDLADASVRGQIDGKEVNFQGEDDLYRRELEVFVEAVREERQSIIHSDFTDSLKSLSTTLSAVKALEEGRLVRL